MLSSLCSFINENINSSSVERLVETGKKNKVVTYRDELDRKKPCQSKPKKKVTFHEPTPLVQKVGCEKNFHAEDTTCAADTENKASLKIKILMTKEEAARLLSKCKDGGVLEFKDVARELVQIPANRVSLVSSSSTKSSDLLPENIRKEH